MRTAERKDKKLVVKIISESFMDNPSVNSVIPPNAKSKKRKIAGLARYAFLTAYSRGGVYISSDETGVAVCYKYNAKRESLSDYLNQAVLAITTIGLANVYKVLTREAYVKSKRPDDGNYLYFWFFGVTDAGKGRGAAKELQKAIFEESELKDLPIYLETSVEKNKRVYEHFGFETYHEWHAGGHCKTLWFMRKVRGDGRRTNGFKKPGK